MNAAQFDGLILGPSIRAISDFVSPSMISDKAELLLLAIAGQESAWTNRSQLPGGQAHGFWQCEQGGAVAGVMAGQCKVTLALICEDYEIPYDTATVFEAIVYHDPLAFVVARFALWMDPAPLPEIGDEDGAWEVYERVWRPGKPSRDRWSSVYPQAVAVING